VSTYSIDLHFVRGKSLSSDLIAYFGGGKYSHVDAVLPAGYGYPAGSYLGARDDIVKPLGGGAPIPRGVQVRPAGYEQWRFADLWSLPTTKAAHETFYGFLVEQIGKPYDWRSIVGFATGDYDWRDPQAWFCMELAAAALEKALHIRFAFPTHVITPNAGAIAFSALGAKKKAVPDGSAATR
jgi:hypothetical protein